MCHPRDEDIEVLEPLLEEIADLQQKLNEAKARLSRVMLTVKKSCRAPVDAYLDDCRWKWCDETFDNRGKRILTPMIADDENKENANVSMAEASDSERGCV